MNKCIPTPDGKPAIDQRTDTLKVHLNEPMSFIRMTYRNIGKGLHKSINDLKTAMLPGLPFLA